MTDDMIERVARVLHGRSDHAATWDELDDYWQTEYRLDARAAIAAMSIDETVQFARRQIGFIDALQMVECGFDDWKSKPHNAKWFKLIDGTPIPNDLTVSIAKAIAKTSEGEPWSTT